MLVVDASAAAASAHGMLRLRTLGGGGGEHGGGGEGGRGEGGGEGRHCLCGGRRGRVGRRREGGRLCGGMWPLLPGGAWPWWGGSRPGLA